MNSLPTRRHAERWRIVDATSEQRLLLTCILVICSVTWAIGIMLLVHHNRGADGEPSLSVRDLQVRFSDGESSLFVARIKGDMREHLRDARELEQLIAWAASGASQELYQRDVAALLDDRCVRCHRPTGEASFRPLDTYQQVRQAVQEPSAPPFSRQLVITKVHLVGIGAMLAFVAALFLSTDLPIGFKRVVVVAAFAGLLIDFGSWWAMRSMPAFAWGRALGGVMSTASFALMCSSTLLLLWRGPGGDLRQGNES